MSHFLLMHNAPQPAVVVASLFSRPLCVCPLYCVAGGRKQRANLAALLQSRIHTIVYREEEVCEIHQEREKKTRSVS